MVYNQDTGLDSDVMIKDHTKLAYKIRCAHISYKITNISISHLVDHIQDLLYTNHLI